MMIITVKPSKPSSEIFNFWYRKKHFTELPYIFWLRIYDLSNKHSRKMLNFRMAFYIFYSWVHCIFETVVYIL